MGAQLSERKIGIIKRLAQDTNLTLAEIADYPGVKCSVWAVNTYSVGIRLSRSPGSRALNSTEEIHEADRVRQAQLCGDPCCGHRRTLHTGMPCVKECGCQGFIEPKERG